MVLFAVVLFASPGCGNCKFGTVEKIQIGIVGILLVYQITVTRYIANLHVADFYFFRHRIVLSQNTDTCDITRGISMLAVVDAVVKSPLYLPPSELYTGRSCAIPCPDVVPG